MVGYSRWDAACIGMLEDRLKFSESLPAVAPHFGEAASQLGTRTPLLFLCDSFKKILYIWCYYREVFSSKNEKNINKNTGVAESLPPGTAGKCAPK